MYPVYTSRWYVRIIVRVEIAWFFWQRGWNCWVDAFYPFTSPTFRKRRMSEVEQLAVLGIDEEDARRALRATGAKIAILLQSWKLSYRSDSCFALRTMKKTSASPGGDLEAAADRLLL